MLELELLGVREAEGTPVPVVLLRHEDRVLPILIGFPEASAIQYGLIGEKTTRPMTHDLICNLLAGLRGRVQSLCIYKLEDDTFFAHLNIEQRSTDGEVEQVLRVDARPSDGIAIATRVGCPILAAEAVMEAAGQEVGPMMDADEDDEDNDEG